jgi:hypothetical protein
VTTTADLIEAMATNLRPVRRLRSPVVRAGSWLLLAAVVLALLAISQGLRADLSARLLDPAFVVGIAASLTTGALAAVAAFMASLPDRSRLWLLLPLPALAVWLAGIGGQCLTHWVAFDPAGLALGETARCLATLVLTSLPLSLAMMMMLRYAVLSPTAVTLMGSLAVAAITASALSLFHALDATAMILMWNVGTAALFLSLGGFLSRRNAAWVAAARTTQEGIEA